jgi:hypothetical protein
MTNTTLPAATRLLCRHPRGQPVVGSPRPLHDG